MKTLILVSACVIFAGCAKTEQLYIQNMPEELKDCKAFFIADLDAKVIRCPNSSTTTSYRAVGRNSYNKTVTLIDEG